MKITSSKKVDVHVCPACGHTFPPGLTLPGNETRFKCPACGTSILNTNSLRCPACHSLCSDAETFKAHKWQGCSLVGTKYPLSELMR